MLYEVVQLAPKRRLGIACCFDCVSCHCAASTWRSPVLPRAAPPCQLDAVRDLGNYALCARGRFQLGRRLTLNGVVEAPDADRLQRRIAQRLSERRQAASAAAEASAAEAAAHGDGSIGAAAVMEVTAAGAADGANGSASGPGVAAAAAVSTPGGPPVLEPCTAHATLRCALPGHDLSATAGYNLSYLDSTGDAAHVPLAVSLDLSSHDRQDGLQYRVGLHQVGLRYCVAAAQLAGGACASTGYWGAAGRGHAGTGCLAGLPARRSMRQTLR